MAKATLSLSPPLRQIQAEAEAMGVGFPALLTADIVRYRALAEAATPELTEWQWSALGHVLDGIEMHRIISGDDSLPSAGGIVAEVETWADAGDYADMERAGELRRLAAGWSPLAVAGVLFRLRSEANR